MKTLRLSGASKAWLGSYLAGRTHLGSSCNQRRLEDPREPLRTWLNHRLDISVSSAALREDQLTVATSLSVDLAGIDRMRQVQFLTREGHLLVFTTIQPGVKMDWGDQWDDTTTAHGQLELVWRRVLPG